eukprot:GHVN01096205.1.p1 GENE.GHVN01096205.1~~GHVN01096205.1.p1  ORF type:complete len:594 (-),score=50.17 GHVN01096205.1:1244-3025(-)
MVDCHVRRGSKQDEITPWLRDLGLERLSAFLVLHLGFSSLQAFVDYVQFDPQAGPELLRRGINELDWLELKRSVEEFSNDHHLLVPPASDQTDRAPVRYSQEQLRYHRVMRQLGLDFLLADFAEVGIHSLRALNKLVHDSKRMDAIGVCLGDQVTLKAQVPGMYLWQERGDHLMPVKNVQVPVRGLVSFPAWIWDSIIDTPHMQRLKSLKQLGVVFQVFPGAQHTRFEHSLGVATLGRQMFDNLADTCRGVSSADPEVERMRKCVLIAGLCHDWGHGPFSHSFETFMNKKYPEAEWHHEDMSLTLFDDVVGRMDDCPEYDSDMTKTIKQMIVGSEKPTPVGLDPLEELQRASIDITANKRSGMDVDRFDYLERDAVATGVAVIPFNLTRLLKFNRVIDGQICFNRKEVPLVWDMCYSRYCLNKVVYQHRKVTAIDMMYTDVMALLDDVFKISSKIHDVNEYLNSPLFQDTIVNFTGMDPILLNIDDESDVKLKSARKLLNDVTNRNLYRFVDEEFMTAEQADRMKGAITSVSVAACHDKLDSSDLEVTWIAIHYGSQSENPWDTVKFFKPGEETSGPNSLPLRLGLTLPFCSL